MIGKQGEKFPVQHRKDDRYGGDGSQGGSERERRQALRQEILYNNPPPVIENFEQVKAYCAQHIETGEPGFLKGETGSGKSIGLPLAISDALKQMELPENVVVLQPRRDAAKNVAELVATLRDEPLWRSVGYSTSEVRRERHDTQISVMTPGILLRWIKEGKVNAGNIGAIIVDEAHERNKDYDFIKGLLKIMREEGDAPALFFASATMNEEEIGDLLEIEPAAMEIEGRQHPVEVEYSSMAKYVEGDNRKYVAEVSESVARELSDVESDGDILVFLPGMKEINLCMRQIEESLAASFENVEEIELVKLHGSLTFEERSYALSGKKPDSIKRRVVIATDIAETSLTVPDITTVVDSCRRRSFWYDEEKGINRMGTQYISKSQADQRAGRSGRLGPGKCIRMIDEFKYAQLPDQPVPEIHNINLAELAIQVSAQGYRPTDFPFPEQPDIAKWEHAIQELKLLEALDEDEHVTQRGLKMAKMPFEPRLSTVFLEGRERGIEEKTLVAAIVARELGGRSFFSGPSKADQESARGYDSREKRNNARNDAMQQLRETFGDCDSDWLMNIRILAHSIDEGLFEVALNRKNDVEYQSNIQNLRSWCMQHRLNLKSLTHVAAHIFDYARSVGTRIERDQLKEILLDTTTNESLRRSILFAYPDNILKLTDEYRGVGHYTRYQGQSNGSIMLSPGSVAFSHRPDLCVATAGITEGGGKSRGVDVKRLYAHGVSPCTLEDIVAVYPEKVAVIENRPSYDGKSGEVQAVNECMLAGTSHRIGSIERELSQEEIQEVLVQVLTDWYSLRIPAEESNQKILSELRDLRTRSGGSVELPDMELWYKEHIGNALTKSDLEALGNELVLNAEEYCSGELRDQIDQACPKEVIVQGKHYTVEYGFTSSESGDTSQSATISMTMSDVFEIQQQDIPVLSGMHGEIPMTIRVTVGWNNKISADIEALKDELDEYRVDQEWEQFSQNESDSILELKEGEALPEDISLEYPRKEYAQDRSGEVFYAHAGITSSQVYENGRGYIDRFVVRYFRSEEDARDAIAEARELRSDTLQLEQDKVGFEDRIAHINAAVEEMDGNYDARGLSYYDHYDLVQDVRNAKYELERANTIQGLRGLEARIKKMELTLEDGKRAVQERTVSIQQEERELDENIVDISGRVQDALKRSLDGEAESIQEDLRLSWDRVMQYRREDVARARMYFGDLEAYLAEVEGYQAAGGLSLGDVLRSAQIARNAPQSASKKLEKIDPAVMLRDEPSQPQERKEITEEEKDELMNSLDAATALVGLIRSDVIGERPTVTNTKKRRAQDTLYKKKKSVMDAIRQARIVIKQEAKSDVCNSRQRDAIKSVSSVFKSTMEHILPDFDRNIMERYLDLSLRDELMQGVMQDGDVRDLVEGEFADELAIRNAVQAILTERIEDVMCGREISPEEIAKDIFDQFME